jgi:hypothetical protein
LVALAAPLRSNGCSSLTPAQANYDRCYENPAATGCPGNYDVTGQFYLYLKASHERTAQRTAALVCSVFQLDAGSSYR